MIAETIAQINAILRPVRRRIYSMGKWVVQWDTTILAPEHNRVYIAMGASHGRVYVLSYGLRHLPDGPELVSDGLYQLPYNWHDDAKFNPFEGRVRQGLRADVIAALTTRAHALPHIVTGLEDATAQRNFEHWFFPPPDSYWHWCTTYKHHTGATRPDNEGLKCAFQHPRVTRKERVPCLHCAYPFDGSGAGPVADVADAG